ncbi:MAG: hypothetical protein WKF84_12150 [Pyrinomonadaceae bacterium]
MQDLARWDRALAGESERCPRRRAICSSNRTSRATATAGSIRRPAGASCQWHNGARVAARLHRRYVITRAVEGTASSRTCRACRSRTASAPFEAQVEALAVEVGSRRVVASSDHGSRGGIA